MAMPSSKLASTLIRPLLVCMIWALCFPAVVSKNFLLRGERLLQGRSLDYCNYELVMQNDCNLVLYDSGNAVWQTNTAGADVQCFLWMRDNGNLGLFIGDGTFVWESNTEDGDIFILQPNRNLVVYGRAIWSSNTNVPGDGITVAAPKVANERQISSI